VRRKLALAAGAAAGAVAAVLLRRRPAAEPATDARTEELRRKLAEAREAEPPAQPTAAEPEPVVDVEEARRRVHEEGRSAVDEMQRSGEDVDD
jgi:hypothetical protein